MRTPDSEEMQMEKEASQFAMCLLMPENFVRAEVKKLGGNFDIENGKMLKELADKFKVSVTVMAIRIGQIYHL